MACCRGPVGARGLTKRVGLLKGEPQLAAIVHPLLDTWRQRGKQIARFDKAVHQQISGGAQSSASPFWTLRRLRLRPDYMLRLLTPTAERTMTRAGRCADRLTRNARQVNFPLSPIR
jgi:hypothetical protein